MPRSHRTFFFVALALALARYLVVAFFVHPFADDFSYAVAGMRTDLLPRLWDEYHLWNGRWFSNILVLRSPLVLGLDQGLMLYRLVPIALMALTWFGAFALVRVCWTGLARRDALIAASCFLLLYLQMMPDLSEGIYWYTGAVSYQLPGALTLLLAASWMQGFAAQRIGVQRMIVNVTLAVVISGCTELHMVFMLVFHLALLMKAKGGSTLFRSAVVASAFVLFAAAVMILAPGNEGRGGQFPHRHDLLLTLGWGAVQTARFLFEWIASPALIIASVMVLSINDPVKKFRSASHPLRIAVVIVAVVFMAMALPYWATGLLGQHRTVNATLLFFLPLWFYFLLALQAKWQRVLARIVVPGTRLWIPAAMLVLVVCFTGSGGKVSLDLADGRLVAFDDELKRRYHEIEGAHRNGWDRLNFPAVQSLPRSLRYNDGGPDPEQWINRSIAYYFGADDMRITVRQKP